MLDGFLPLAASALRCLRRSSIWRICWTGTPRGKKLQQADSNRDLGIRDAVLAINPLEKAVAVEHGEIALREILGIARDHSVGLHLEGSLIDAGVFEILPC